MSARVGNAKDMRRGLKGKDLPGLYLKVTCAILGSACVYIYSSMCGLCNGSQDLAWDL